MLRIVLDSAGDMPPDWVSKYDLDIIPININFGENSYLQGIDLSNADFYRKANESQVFPKTSQPSPQQFVNFYQRVAKPHDTVISIHVTSKLSGTFNSAIIAARELIGNLNIIPIDSASGSASMGFMAREARLMERAGYPIQKIIERLHFIAQHVQILLTINTLDYARRSGRIKTLQAVLASVLNIKPVIALRDGALEVADRVRTRTKSLEYLIQEMYRRMGDQFVNLAIVHAEDVEAAKWLAERAKAIFKFKEIILTELSIGIAANLGPGTVGIVAYPVGEE